MCKITEHQFFSRIRYAVACRVNLFPFSYPVNIRFIIVLNAPAQHIILAFPASLIINCINIEPENVAGMVEPAACSNVHDTVAKVLRSKVFIEQVERIGSPYIIVFLFHGVIIMGYKLMPGAVPCFHIKSQCHVDRPEYVCFRPIIKHI